MDLTHTRFRHAQYIRDLSQEELFGVVERDYCLLLLRQLLDFLDEQMLELLPLDLTYGVVAARIDEHRG